MRSFSRLFWTRSTLQDNGSGRHDDDNSGNLEDALIRLEEEHQRCLKVVARLRAGCVPVACRLRAGHVR